MPSIPPDNMSYPVRIAIGDRSFGTGFYCNTDRGIYLVTATHVLFRRSIELFGPVATLTSLASDLTSTLSVSVDLSLLQDDGGIRRHNRADVTVVRIGTASGPTPNAGEQRTIQSSPGITLNETLPPGVGFIGMPITLFRKLANVEMAGPIILFAYPGSSLGHPGQIDRTRPLLRQGMIAGKTDDNLIVIDCPSYFGNSGGLVVEIDETFPGQKRFWGIGIVIQTIPFIEELWSKQFNIQTGLRYENSGYSLVVPMDRIEELLQEFEPSSR